MTDPTAPGNKKDRLQWFNEIGFGMFIHWSVDGQIGSVIGHSMAAASEDYLNKFCEILPSTFNPKRFDPDEWAVLFDLPTACQPRRLRRERDRRNRFSVSLAETVDGNV